MACMATPCALGSRGSQASDQVSAPFLLAGFSAQMTIFCAPTAPWYLCTHFSGQEVVKWLPLPGGQASSEDQRESSRNDSDLAVSGGARWRGSSLPIPISLATHACPARSINL